MVFVSLTKDNDVGMTNAIDRGAILLALGRTTEAINCFETTIQAIMKHYKTRESPNKYDIDGLAIRGRTTNRDIMVQLATIYEGLGTAHGNSTAAYGNLLIALQLARQSANSSVLCAVLCDLGRYYRNTGQFNYGINAFESAREYCSTVSAIHVL